jgi:hypothetical protein
MIHPSPIVDFYERLPVAKLALGLFLAGRFFTLLNDTGIFLWGMGEVPSISVSAKVEKSCWAKRDDNNLFSVTYHPPPNQKMKHIQGPSLPETLSIFF